MACVYFVKETAASEDHYRGSLPPTCASILTTLLLYVYYMSYPHGLCVLREGSGGQRGALQGVFTPEVSAMRVPVSFCYGILVTKRSTTVPQL